MHRFVRSLAHSRMDACHGRSGRAYLVPVAQLNVDHMRCLSKLSASNCLQRRELSSRSVCLYDIMGNACRAFVNIAVPGPDKVPTLGEMCQNFKCLQVPLYGRGAPRLHQIRSGHGHMVCKCRESCGVRGRAPGGWVIQCLIPRMRRLCVL